MLTRLFLGASLLFMTTTLPADEPVIQPDRPGERNAIHSDEEKSEPVGAEASSFLERVQAKEARYKLFGGHDADDDEDDGWNAHSLLTRSAAAPVPSDYFAYPGYSHFVIGFADDSSIIQLEDGCQWSIAFSDRFIVQSWITGDLVGIYPNHDWFSAYDYRVYNMTTGDSVRSNLGPLGPHVGGKFTQYIVAKDSYYRTVYLSDGTVWEVSSYDAGQLSVWGPGQVVIVGMNDNWWTVGSYSAILINVSTCEFVLAQRR